jgi:hypothetical protein
VNRKGNGAPGQLWSRSGMVANDAVAGLGAVTSAIDSACAAINPNLELHGLVSGMGICAPGPSIRGLVSSLTLRHLPRSRQSHISRELICKVVCRKLHTFGLLNSSFSPAEDIHVLRGYLGQRENLVRAAATGIRHMQKALTEMKHPTG